MSRIRIAVVGGGICGSTLANGLMKHPHLDFDVYEARAVFSEIGASVGLNAPAQRALQIIGNDVRRTIDRAGGVVSFSSRAVVGEGPEQGKVIFDISDVERTINVHRVEFMRELLQPVPNERLHPNKKLMRIEELQADKDGRALRIHFEDGTCHDVDAVIGCDGIHSIVRGAILGADHPAVEPVFAGFWNLRKLVPVEAFAEKFGEDYLDSAEPRQVLYVGDRSFCMHQLIDEGRTVQLLVGGKIDADEWNLTQWKETVTRERLEKTLKNRGKFGEAFIELVLSGDEPAVGWSQWESRTAPVYNKGRMLMMGDAAHATTPWHGSGAGMAIEDACLLQILLAKTRSPSELTAAFKVFDHMRRPRTQQLITSSHPVGLTFTCSNPDIGFDYNKMAEKAPRMWDFIYALDWPTHIKEAEDMFERYNL